MTIKRRISSTSARTHIECERKAVFEYGPDPKREEASFPMAVGTIGHAILEWRTNFGVDPTIEDVRTMKGNYDDPSVVLDLYESHGVWDVAMNSVSCEALADPRAAIFAALEIPEDAVVLDEQVEKPLADFGVYFANGFRAEGFIDHWLVVEGYPPIIFDWKIRGRMDYAPRTAEDFRADIQQTYYPAIVRRALGCDSVIVAHGNILRTDKPGKQVFQPYATEIEGWYLDASFSYYEGVAEAFGLNLRKDPKDVPRNEGRCYKYNRACMHSKYCLSAGVKYDSVIDWAREAWKDRYKDKL